MGTCISTITLRHLQKYSLDKKLMNVSIDEIEGTSLLDMSIFYTNDLDQDLVRKEFTKISTSKNSYRDIIGVYHHKTKKYLGLPLEIVIEKDNESKIFGKLKIYTLRINPSRFKSFDDYSWWVKRLIKDESYIIGRIDFTLLLPRVFFTVEDLARYIYIVKKQNTIHYFESKAIFKPHLGNSENEQLISGAMTGFEIGSYPDRLTIYDAERYVQKEKAKSHFYAAFFNKKFCKIPMYHKQFLTKYGINVTVIERQVHSSVLKKMNIAKVEDLRWIFNAEPFGHVNFINWNLDEVQILKRKNINWLVGFMLECTVRGFHQARSKFNCGNNFHRFQKTLSPLKIFKEKVYLDDYLNQVFKKGMISYFKVDELMSDEESDEGGIPHRSEIDHVNTTHTYH